MTTSPYKTPTSMPKDLGYIGVDMDGCLAHYTSWKPDGSIGDPIPAMVARVKGWLQLGLDVRIISARAAAMGPLGQIPAFDDDQVRRIEEWCMTHIGKRLPVQFWKDYGMIVLYDDRARQVELNTGRVIGE